VQHISYWYRLHTSKSKLPIFYIHGIGILHTYGDFFAELANTVDQKSSQDDQIGISDVVFVDPVASSSIFQI
jgi:hypothetical protein